MPRPTNKLDLLALATKNFEKLLTLVSDLGTKKLENFPPGTLNRNVKDVLAHLHEWHLMLLQWEKVGKTGAKPVIPAEGYTWKTLPALNRLIWEKHKDESFEEILAMVQESHQQVLKVIESYSNEDLFTKKLYKWTGTTSVGAYMVSNTSSHYDWAYKLIKKATK